MGKETASPWARFVDNALEVTVVGSFTRLGLRARRHLFAWDREPGVDISGRVMVVTGATSGLGLETARELAQRGARVHIVGRNPEKTKAAAAELIADTGNEDVDYSLADMGELDQVRALAVEIESRYDRLDVLIQNAGALSATRETNSQGIEQTVASQVLGPFLLTRLLLPLLSKTPGARVITVASGGMYSEPLDVDHLIMTPDEYKGSAAYARAKRAQVALNQEWARREGQSGVNFQAMHPGWADTPGVVKSLPTFRRILGPSLRSPAEGADTIVWLATSDVPMKSNGLFWLDRRPRATHYLPKTKMAPQEMSRLWDWVQSRTTETDEDSAIEQTLGS